MKKITIKSILPAALMVLAWSSCTKMKDVGIMDTGGYTDTTAALKDAGAGGYMGVAIDYPAMVSNSSYSGIVKRDFNQVTFGNLMKHSSIVDNNGNMNFTNTDALLTSVGSMDVFGHTLGWHSQQNATWLKSYSGLTVPAPVELLANGGFETGGTGLSNWATYNAQNGSTVNPTSNAGEFRTGTRAMKVVAAVGEPANQWKVQVASDLFNTTSGKQYTVTYYVKAGSGSGSIRLSTQTSGGGSAQYQGDQSIPSSGFTLITWTFTANSPQTRILFDMGASINTYYIDDASVKEVIPAPTGAQIVLKIDTALNTYVTTMVNRYKTKVKAWDVINELLDDNGNLRNNANSPLPTPTTTDWFVWSEYLGRDYAYKAFKYAEAADPTATLFINDYNLESKPVKLDSLIKMVTELKTRGAKVDGIGTQLHVTRTTSYNSIDQMFIKLAATGLKIHVSELDVRMNPNAVATYSLTPMEENFQAQMYYYVIASYLKNVPKAQQYGITVWGVTDNTSWLYNGGKDYPLMYNTGYGRKQAYAAVLKALRGQ